jgi:hypothetical protein
VVKFARSHDEFIEFCRKETLQPDESAVARGIRMAEENQWEMIVENLEGHIRDVFQEKQSRARASSTTEAAAVMTV